MKSSNDILLKRGFVEAGLEFFCAGLHLEEKISLLQSKVAYQRTLGARLLSTERPENSIINFLIKILCSEKKLYTKIEICNTLVAFGKPAVPVLIRHLGKIGNNQHQTVPQSKFNKKSYPLPRDIVSRTLGYIGTAALKPLLEILYTNDLTQLSEAIDSIGYICFYHHQDGVFNELRACYLRHEANDLIRWKAIRAMSGLPESRGFLSGLLESEENEGIRYEAQRSLSLL